MAQRFGTWVCFSGWLCVSSDTSFLERETDEVAMQHHSNQHVLTPYAICRSVSASPRTHATVAHKTFLRIAPLTLTKFTPICHGETSSNMSTANTQRGEVPDDSLSTYMFVDGHRYAVFLRHNTTNTHSMVRARTVSCGQLFKLVVAGQAVDVSFCDELRNAINCLGAMFLSTTAKTTSCG